MKIIVEVSMGKVGKHQSMEMKLGLLSLQLILTWISYIVTVLILRVQQTNHIKES